MGLNLQSHFWAFILTGQSPKRCTVLVSNRCCDKLLRTSWLKTTHMYVISVVKVRSPKMDLWNYNQGVSCATFFVFSLPFLPFRGCLRSFAHAFFPPASKPTTQHLQLSLSLSLPLHPHFPSLTLVPLFPSYKHIEPTWKIQDTSSSYNP